VFGCWAVSEEINLRGLNPPFSSSFCIINSSRQRDLYVTTTLLLQPYLFILGSKEEVSANFLGVGVHSSSAQGAAIRFKDTWSLKFEARWIEGRGRRERESEMQYQHSGYIRSCKAVPFSGDKRIKALQTRKFFESLLSVDRVIPISCFRFLLLVFGPFYLSTKLG